MIESSLPQSEVSLPVRPFSHRARSIAGYGVGTALMMVTPLLVFVPAALFHCSLRNGRRAAWAAFVLATALAGLYYLQVASISVPGAAVNMAYTLFLAVVLAVALPAVITLPLVERGEKFGNILVFALAGSAVGLGLTEIIMRSVANFSPHAWHVSQWQAQSSAAMQFYRTLNAGADSLRYAQLFFRYGVEILPASFLAEIALVFLLSLMMFGRLRAWKNATTGTKTYLFRNFALPEWLLFGFILGGLTPLTTGLPQKIAANVLALILFLYLLQGLAIFRAMIASSGVGIFGATIAILTMVMLCAMGVGILLLIVVGLFDPFFDFRKLKRKDDSHESHTD
jgi:hypothetical protein